MKIYISPEVLTYKTYAWGDTNEHVQMTKLADLVEQEYRKYGGQAKTAKKSLTVTTKTNTANGRSVSGRIADAVTWGADIYVGLHSNARGNTSRPAKGAVLFYDQADLEGKRIADIVYKELAEIMPHDSPQGDVRPHNTFYEVQEPKHHGMTAVYIETEFHDQADNAKWIVQNLSSIAEAIAKGFALAFGLVKQGADSSGGGASGAGDTYTVKRGDTLWSIAAKELGDGAKYTELQKLNNLTGSTIYAGQVLRLSDASPRTYTVKVGDTLWGIAAKELGSGVRHSEISDLNNLKNSTIFAGQVLRLPVK